MRLPLPMLRPKAAEKLLERAARGLLRWAADDDALLTELAHPARLWILLVLSHGPLATRALAREVARECELSPEAVEAHHIRAMRRLGALDPVRVPKERGPAVRGYLPSRRAMPLAMALRELVDAEPPGESRRLLHIIAERARPRRKGARR